MKTLFEHSKAFWGKYSDYEWRMAEDGKEYLLPTAEAVTSVYNALPIADDLVLEAINIGLLVMHKRPREQIKAAILKFVRTYGLLGMMTALPTTSYFTEYEKVYLLKNQFIKQESMDTLPYMKLFFPFKMPDYRKRGVESVWTVSGDDRWEATLVATFNMGNDPRGTAMCFLRSYGEPYEWLTEVFLDWAFTFASSYMYYRDRDVLDENGLRLYRRGLACFEGNAPAYHLALKDHTVIVWDFHSLMLAVKFLFSIKLTDTKNPMKLCDHCQKAFIARRADVRFCSSECRNKASKKP